MKETCVAMVISYVHGLHDNDQRLHAKARMCLRLIRDYTQRAAYPLYEDKRVLKLSKIGCTTIES